MNNMTDKQISRAQKFLKKIAEAYAQIWNIILHANGSVF